MKEKQTIREVRFRGLSRAMSDLEVKSGGCAESVNVIVDNDEIMTAVPPVEVTDNLPSSGNYDLLYIHKTPSYSHYIGLLGSNLCWFNSGNCTTILSLNNGETISDLKGIGNTLVVATSTRMLYILFRQNPTSGNSEYHLLGTTMPFPSVKFGMTDPKTYTAQVSKADTTTVQNANSFITQLITAANKDSPGQAIYYDDDSSDNVSGSFTPSSEQWQKEAKLLRSMINEAVENIYGTVRDNSRFCRPFFVRYGVRLHDGSYGKLSAPILMRPTDRYPFLAWVLGWSTSSQVVDVKTIGAKLSYKITLPTGWSSWSDVIQGIDFFVSDNINSVAMNAKPRRIGGTHYLEKEFAGRKYATYTNSDVTNYGDDNSMLQCYYMPTSGGNSGKIMKRPWFYGDVYSVDMPNEYGGIGAMVVCDNMKGEKLDNAVCNASNFYLMQSLGMESVGTYTSQYYTFGDISSKLGDGLFLQTRLPDNYRDHHEMIPDKLFEYNSRLNMFGVTSKLYAGFPLAMQSQAELQPTLYNDNIALGASGREQWKYGHKDINHVKFKVYIKGDDGKTMVVSTDTDETVHIGPWLFYPDSRAYKIVIHYQVVATTVAQDGTSNTGAAGSGYFQMELPLKEHPYLNGAYYFGGFASGAQTTGLAGTSSSSSFAMTELNNTEENGNKLYQSEVSNPFRFEAGNIHTISGGTILGMATTTRAISQGQFGQYPLYVFCTEGIWALQVGNDGKYISSAPMSREVCSNASSITMIDGAVVFVAKKGVMLISGADVVNMSEGMDGRYESIDGLASGLEQLASTAFSSWGTSLPTVINETASFLDYIQDCFIAYDYSHSWLILTNDDYDYQYIYCIKSKTWHKLCFDIKFKRAVNSYPDCYLQQYSTTAAKVYNFSFVTDVNDSSVRNWGMLVSRGFDLDSPEEYKTIMKIYHRGDFLKGKVSMVLYGSRDNIHYQRVPSLMARSYKMYKVAIFFYMLPKERYNRTSFAIKSKWGNKIR